jgi:hypothetical protein
MFVNIGGTVYLEWFFSILLPLSNEASKIPHKNLLSTVVIGSASLIAALFNYCWQELSEDVARAHATKSVCFMWGTC